MSNCICCDRLYRLRMSFGFTQQDVADILHISRVSYNYYETGNRSVPLHILWPLADLYHTSIDYLCGRSNVR